LLDRLLSIAKVLRRNTPARLHDRLQTAQKTSHVAFRTAEEAARMAEVAGWNTKVMGSSIAARLYESGRAGPGAPLPPQAASIGLGGRLCRQEDIEADWLRHWCGRVGFAPLYHRKVWEDCFALQVLHEHGMMTPGRRGLGFAVGEEWLPSFLAARGAEILATDLDAEDGRASTWIATDQHGGRAEALFKPRLIHRETFDARVALRAVDMNAIPEDLHGGFDFLWSICSFEHCGSIGQGLDFVVEAMKCLRPGGLAVHTTEFNLDPAGATIEDGPTVLFQRHHIEELARRLEAEGHHMLPVDFSPGAGVLDAFVDLPPYPGTPGMSLPYPDSPHLRLLIGGMVATSIGLVIRKAG